MHRDDFDNDDLVETCRTKTKRKAVRIFFSPADAS